MNPSYSRAYKRYVTILLLIVYIFNRVDAGVFTLLMESIKHDLGLSDTQIGFLAGPALVLFYALLGVPVARWADRSHRVNIMSAAVALWSGVVMLTSAVGAFWQVSLARIGVGIGEAGFYAVAQSVVTDYHTHQERTRALGILTLGVSLGAVTSHLMGGWLNQAYGWRVVFIAAGLPGLLLAVLLKTTVREPVRVALTGNTANVPRSSLRQVFQDLWASRTLRHLLVAHGLASIAVFGIVGWLPAFYIRVYGMTTGVLGTWFAVTVGIGATAGIWFSGYLTSRWSARDERMKVWLTAIATTLVVPIIVLVLWHPSKLFSLLLLIPVHFMMMFFLTPVFSLVQELSKANMRATMASIFILVQGLGGSLIGLQVLGILSDVLTPIVGDSATALRWSMTLGSLFALWGTVHFWLAGRTLRQDLVSSAP